MTALFHDRRDAGKQLAKKLSIWAERDDVIVLALPRGGVPVAFEVGQALCAPLDLMLVRKLGTPGQEEVAMGAIALPDVRVFNHDVIRNVAISQEYIDMIVEKEFKELLRRNHHYRNDEPPPDLKDKIVILVDDGVATGANMRAAINASLQQNPFQIVAAFPTASGEAVEMLKGYADDIVCLYVLEPFFGVGQAYDNFSQVEDNEVLALLEKSRHWGKGHVKFVK